MAFGGNASCDGEKGGGGGAGGVYAEGRDNDDVPGIGGKGALRFEDS